MDSIECIIVGGGVVGIAIARELAFSGREVLLIEAEPSFGTGNSSRNSEVIHAGIYYPHDSLMAKLCVEGRWKLYDFCRENHIEHHQLGKLIVATNEQEADKLAAIAAHASLNGVSDLRRLSKADAVALEPELQVSEALHSPSTGIVDSHGFMTAMIGQAETEGAMFVYRSPFLGATVGEEIEVSVGGSEATRLKCRWLINSAGLQATEVASRMEGYPAARTPRTYYAKGNYFALSGCRAPFRRLIYPVPVAGGLGVHLTLDLAGQARFGPDVEWIDTINFDVDGSRANAFYSAIRRYWPALPDDSLVPAYSGIRPKIVGPEVAKQDFRIDGPADHGVKGLIQLFGIESPGLTSSLAIASLVNEIIAGSN